jgi:quercetin dioxygenase-like cupin family protein
VRAGLLCGLCLLPLVAAADPPGLIRTLPDEIPWVAGPPSLPPGSEVAVLEGDPKGEGLFTMRVRLPAGARLALHWHPQPERVTVLSGSIGIGYGDVFEPAKLQLFRAGSYYMTPPGVRHYGACFEDTVVQITTTGPWQLHPAATPAGASP